MRATMVLCVLLALAGCATSPETVTVEVAVPVFCEPPVRARPSLPLDALPQDADLFEVTRAAKASVETLEAYAERLEADTNACRARVP